MNILGYIDSKDIRKYLKEKEHSFNALEAACIVNNCNTVSIEKKHKAYKWIIKHMPDCDIKKDRMWKSSLTSIHSALKDYIKYEDELIEEFLNPHHADTFDPGDRPYVYKMTYEYKDGKRFEWPLICSRFDALYESLMYPDENVLRIYCERNQVDWGERVWDLAVVDNKLDFMEIKKWNVDESDWDIDDLFKGLDIEIPTPFKKGDIVYNPYGSDNRDPFVIKKIQYNHVFSDVNIEAYHIDKNDQLKKTDDMLCFSEYLALEYYRDELKGKYKMLEKVRDHMKGKIELADCINDCHKIMNEYS